MFEWIEMDLYHAIAAHEFKTKNELFHLNSFAGNMFGIGELSMDFDILRRIRSRTLSRYFCRFLLKVCWLLSMELKNPHTHRDNAMLFAPTFLTHSSSLQYL